MNIIVSGSIAYDYIMRFPGRFAEHILPDQLHKISLSFLVDEMRRQWGGCAANIAYNLALLGERPYLMGTVGQDFGQYREWLESSGVDTTLAHEEPDLFTASFFVSTDLDGNQIASFYTGAMARARNLSLHNVTLRPIDLVTISPDDPEAMVRRVAECQNLEIDYLYDPSQQIVRLDGEMLRAGISGCAILIVNDYEFELLQEKTGWHADEIREKPSRACIVTLGADGASIFTRETTYNIPAVTPETLDDPTGVGDAFRAGLVKGLAIGLPWDLAGRMGSLAATYTLEQPGPQSHRYTRAEFVARFREHFDDGGALDAILD
ncbi:MAG: carbohydrate kinase family protein [Chloroflexi bacterium]|nr:carbohydrate kinase family protein [Chloroflexota bacterium]